MDLEIKYKMKKKLILQPFNFEYYIISETLDNCIKIAEKENLKEIDNTTSATLYESEKGYMTILFNKDSIKPDTRITIIHESVHLAVSLLNYAGVPLSIENDEILAYTISHIAKEIYKKFGL